MQSKKVKKYIASNVAFQWVSLAANITMMGAKGIMTGVRIHKLASTLFLLLSVLHGVCYRRKLGVKRWLLIALVVISFATGIFGMILDEYPLVLMLHRALPILLVFFMAIHIFVFHRKLTHK